MLFSFVNYALIYLYCHWEGNAGKSKWRKWPNCSIYRQYAEPLNLHFSYCLLLLKASAISVTAVTKQHEQNCWQIPFSSGVVCKSGLVWRLRLMAYSPCDETLESWASICWKGWVRGLDMQLACTWKYWGYRGRFSVLGDLSNMTLQRPWLWDSQETAVTCTLTSILTEIPFILHTD